MKALVLTDYHCFEYQDVPDPVIETGEVLIDVKACGICGSDVHGMDGSSGRRQPPIIMGHEAAGVISRVGNGVDDFTAGDHVTFDSTIYCGACHYCRRGRINLCENRRVLGVSCDDYRRHGALAEQVVVPRRILYRLPEGIGFNQAAMVEPLSVAFHAVDITPVSVNDSAVVVGAGMIGLLIVQVLRAAGCGRIIAVDLDQKRLDLACKLGADVALKPDEVDFLGRIYQLTHERGVDHVFEAVGIEPTVNLAVNAVRKGGTVTLVGNLAPEVKFPLQAVVTREITVYGSCASNGEYPACLNLIARGAVNVDALISAAAPLSEGTDWFKRLYKNEEGLLKVILNP